MNDFQPVGLYSVAQALPGSEGFYEREEEFAEVLALLQAGHSVSVTGERRAGKTTFLRYLATELPPNEFIPAFVDAQFTGNDQEFLTELIEQALEAIVERVKPATAFPLQLPDMDEEVPSKARRLFREDLNVLRQALAGTPYRVVWLIDEIEILRAFENTVLFRFLRPFAEQDAHFRMVVASYDALYILSSKSDWSPFFNAFQPVKLRGLAPVVAQRLVNDGLAQMGLTVNPNMDVHDVLLSWAGQKPFYLKWGLHSIGKAINEARIDYQLSASIWEAAKAIFLREETLDGHFKNLWDERQEAKSPQAVQHITDRQRIVLSFIATQSGPYIREAILENMQNLRLVTWDNPSQNLIQDLKRLEQLAFLDNLIGHYRFTSGCLQAWIAQSKPL